MAQNDFLVFNENDNNVLTQSEYSSDSQRIDGLQGGIASSKLHNKVLRQLSIATYSLAKIITDSGQDALDDDPEAFYNNLKTVLQQVQGATENIAGILEIANNSDVDAVNPANENTANDTKAVTLRKIVRGIRNKKLISQASQTVEGVTRFATVNELASPTPPQLPVTADNLKTAIQNLISSGGISMVKNVFRGFTLVTNQTPTASGGYARIDFNNQVTNINKTIVLVEYDNQSASGAPGFVGAITRAVFNDYFVIEARPALISGVHGVYIAWQVIEYY